MSHSSLHRASGKNVRESACAGRRHWSLQGFVGCAAIGRRSITSGSRSLAARPRESYWDKVHRAAEYWGTGSGSGCRRQRLDVLFEGLWPVCPAVLESWAVTCDAAASLTVTWTRRTRHCYPACSREKTLDLCFVSPPPLLSPPPSPSQRLSCVEEEPDLWHNVRATGRT